MRKLLTAVLALLVSPAFAQSPCDGKITDKVAHNMNPAAVAKPAAGESYIDPVFNTLITRISNTNPSEGENAVTKSLYATMQGWNSDESLIIAWHRGGSGRRYEIYDGDAPYAHRKTVDLNQQIQGVMEAPSDLEQVVWSNTDPLVLYYPSASPGGKVVKHTLNLSGADTAIVVHNFSALCPSPSSDYTFSMGGDPYQSSDPGGDQIIALKCYNAASGKDLQIIYNITDDVVESSGVNLWYDNGPAGISGWALPDSSGAFFQCHNACDTCVAPGPGCTSYPIVTDLGLVETLGVTHLYRNYREHQALAFTPGNYSTFNRVQFDQIPYGSLISYRLDTGVHKTVIGMDNGWPYPWTSTHVSSGSSGGSGWVAVGSVGDGSGQGVLNNELVLANVYTDEVCRIAHIRTTGRDGPWGYWGEAHSQISRDGYRVLFSSDWLSSSTVDVYVADLRPMSTTVITTTVPNAVQSEAYSRTLQALGGIGAPYDWTRTVGTWPGGLTMNGSGVISGTPTTVETQAVTVQACDQNTPPLCDTQNLSLTVQQRPTITTSSPLADHVVGSAYGGNLTATGGVAPYIWTIANGSLCNGLTLGTDGSLSGTPITLQTCNFTARATDSHAQPIAQTKAFALTIELPGACQPGGSSVCMRLQPLDTKVLARYGQMGLDAEADCNATIKLNGTPIQSIDSLSGNARRLATFTGLSPSTLYTVDASCSGLADNTSDVVTTGPLASGSHSVALQFGAPTITAARIMVEYDDNEALSSPATSQNTSCASGCTVSLPLNAGLWYYRHKWQTAADVVLATSAVQPLQVQ